MSGYLSEVARLPPLFVASEVFMYGIVEIGGHQYRVEAGTILDVEKISADQGKSLEFDQVLFIGGEKPAVGLPTVEGAKVTATVIRQGKGKKQIVFKRRPGGYKRKNGHRQLFTSLLVTEIADGKGQSNKIDPQSKEAKKYLSK